MSAQDQGAPSPGSWQLDLDHHERPMPPFLGEIMPETYTEGFRSWMGRYGTPIETIEFGLIEDFPYTVVRPVGAPPEARSAPPKFVLKVLSRIHPEMRLRERNARQLFENCAWRQDRENYLTEVHPRAMQLVRELAKVDLRSQSDEQLAAHLDRCSDVCREVFSAHYRIVGTHIVPVGDFLAHGIAWTGAAPSELLSALRGCSEASKGAEPELRRAATALAHVDQTIDDNPEGAKEMLHALASEKGEVGTAVSAWLEHAEVSTVSGNSFMDVTGRDVPHVLLRTLADAVANQREEKKFRAAADEAADVLRSRVPELERNKYDQLLAEARESYGLRDLRADGLACGLTKHALEEAGRRLVARDCLYESEHALSLKREELKALLRGADSPCPEAAVRTHLRFTSRTVKDVPELVGPTPLPPPPAEVFPEGMRRAHEALSAYMEAMFTGEVSESNRRCGAEKKGEPIVGHGASAGVMRGSARVVRSPADFDRIKKGDILIAPITTPHYNVVLPLLGGVVTDRGGILSHPAIVAREFGIPGVVGTRVATKMIPDGAVVEVDGGAGTVQVIG